MLLSDYNDRFKRSNRELVEACVDNFLEEEPLIDPAVELQLVQELDAKITLEEVNKYMREVITNRNQVVTLYGPEKKGFALPSKRRWKSSYLRHKRSVMRLIKRKIWLRN